MGGCSEKRQELEGSQVQTFPMLAAKHVGPHTEMKSFLPEGRTVMILKGGGGEGPGNYRPITCLISGSTAHLLSPNLIPIAVDSLSTISIASSSAPGLPHRL